MVELAETYYIRFVLHYLLFLIFLMSIAAILTYRRYKLAVKERARHNEAFELFCEFQKDNIKEWAAMVESYERGDVAASDSPYKAVEVGECFPNHISL